MVRCNLRVHTSVPLGHRDDFMVLRCETSVSFLLSFFLASHTFSLPKYLPTYLTYGGPPAGCCSLVVWLVAQL
ncbi:hypothetical protein F5Y15DRAFT_329117 [Xylariaceae sp. FL0016]|nr:hypothetical protein F5Y15DRAFT_329117 [Xylariaceae sp. FL0016]